MTDILVRLLSAALWCVVLTVLIMVLSVWLLGLRLSRWAFPR